MVHLNQMLIATNKKEIDISSEKKTREFAKQICKSLKKGDILYLSGEMGVGKTTFAKFLINDFQKKNNEKITEVISPTFNIMNEYVAGDLTIKHYDLFRIKSIREINDLNLFDNIKNSILLIEWPEIITKKPIVVKKLLFNYKNNYQERYIKIL